MKTNDMLLGEFPITKTVKFCVFRKINDTKIYITKTVQNIEPSDEREFESLDEAIDFLLKLSPKK